MPRGIEIYIYIYKGPCHARGYIHIIGFILGEVVGEEVADEGGVGLGNGGVVPWPAAVPVARRTCMPPDQPRRRYYNTSTTAPALCHATHRNHTTVVKPHEPNYAMPHTVITPRSLNRMNHFSQGHWVYIFNPYI